MACECASQLAVSQVPYFDSAVPGSGDDGGLESVGAEANAANPVGMCIGILNSVLALTEGIPEFNGAVAGGGHDLAVVNRERDGDDILGVSAKAACCGTG